MILCIFVCISAFRLYNKGKYPFTKIFVLVNGVNGVKECNIFLFLVSTGSISRVSVSTN